MALKSKTPNLDVLNSKWQMRVRRYGSSITGFLWSLTLVLAAAASITAYGVTFWGVLLCALSLFSLVFNSAFFSVAKAAEPNYYLSEWSKAIRERHGDHAVIILNGNDSVTVDAQGRKIDFLSAADAVRASTDENPINLLKEV